MLSAILRAVFTTLSLIYFVMENNFLNFRQSDTSLSWIQCLIQILNLTWDSLFF